MMRPWVWLRKAEALAIHDHLLALNGGIPGIRDEGLLESALTRPRQYATYNQVSDNDVALLAALYTAGVVQNHPFLDGNKRTGFVLGVLFLELNGFGFHAPEEYATAAVFALASGEMDEQQYARFLTDNMTYLNA